MAVPQVSETNGVIRVDGDDLLVTVEGRLIRAPRRCPHRGGPLEKGLLQGAFLRCPWHGATFDLRSGACLRGPACSDLDVAVVEET